MEVGKLNTELSSKTKLLNSKFVLKTIINQTKVTLQSDIRLPKISPK